jgi:hypothetical protein
MNMLRVAFIVVPVAAATLTIPPGLANPPQDRREDVRIEGRATLSIPRTEKAQLGTVVASFSYVQDRHKYYSDFSDLHLSIVRNSVTLLDAPIAPPCAEYCDAEPDGYGKRRSVFVRDVDGDAEPEVIVNIWTGGAHCCTWAYVFRYAPERSTYLLKKHNFGDFGYRLVDANQDGRPEFVGGDFRFAYVFTDFADSLFPIRAWRYEDADFADVTRSFPQLVRRDARGLLTYYRRNRRHRDSRGVLAAYAADQSLLGRREAGFRFVRTALKRSDVQKNGCHAACGRRYLRKLRRFLTRHGYGG